jgi:alpha-tubulin suppressor-like RCC1 family protein
VGGAGTGPARRTPRGGRCPTATQFPSASLRDLPPTPDHPARESANSRAAKGSAALSSSTGPHVGNKVGPHGLEGIVSVSAGYDHACALKEDGTVWCWGHNESGQTGTPPESPDVCRDSQASYYCIRTPRRVEGLNDVEELHAGDYMTCVRRRDRTLWCWGNNESLFSPSRGLGLIGDGLPNTEMCLDPSGAARPCRRRPSRVQGLTNVATFATGGGGCARLLSGETWCWGYAGGVASTTPVQIPFPDLSRDR